MKRRSTRLSRPLQPLRVALAITLGTLLLACASCPFVPGEPTYPSEASVVDEALGPWRDLFKQMARRADAGDAQAARAALGMALDGSSVYGAPFTPTPAQLQLWRCRAFGLAMPCGDPALAA